jgi:protein gp37
MQLLIGLNKFLKTEIISGNFFDHNEINLGISNRKNFRNYANTWILTIRQRRNQDDIKYFLKQMKIEAKCTKTCRI